MVVCSEPEDHLCCARGGDDEVGDGAELEEHEAATTVMLDSEVMEGDVREVADEVQVADDRQPPRRRRQDRLRLLPLVVSGASVEAVVETSAENRQQH
jgi:hypothetical protein